MKLRTAVVAGLLACTIAAPAIACGTPVSVCTNSARGSFELIKSGRPAALFVDPQADVAVQLAAASFINDVERVGGTAPAKLETVSAANGNLVIVGVLGTGGVADQLVSSGKIDAADLRGQWEAFRQIVVERPFPNVARALVIVGADRRGAVYGLYDLSEKIGVSPWHFFADVPVRKRSNLFITAGQRRDQPKVRCRGFFINDEDPAFSGWAKKHFGGVNADAYRHVFELNLRLKGNYLWPAMWSPKAFALDDPRNIALADQMGIVMGTSHHEPMTRAQAEWHRDPDKRVTGGAWDYTKNGENLRRFWRGGIERMISKGDGKGFENLVTVGMRGDGDEPMSESTATELLERIVADQRKIIADVTGKPAEQTPQVWALYKEVQDYYDKGMRVPDDVTLLFADDNWGQARRLPDVTAAPRKGGYGLYYHFDYVGAPRNYKWLNTNQIGKVWQQMNLAYRHGVRNVWVVNVGDIKPMEYPLDFFMDMAWNPDAMTPEALHAFPKKWAAETFGEQFAPEIARLVTEYSEYAARRKPELLDQNTYPLGQATKEYLDGGKFGAIVDDWRELTKRSDQVRSRLSADQQSAYYQLVHFPIAALGNLYELYYAAAWNKQLASRNDPRANYFAHKVETTFARDRELTAEYHSLNGGKWDPMMSQVHMSYVIWNDPTKQSMPSVTVVGADTPPHLRGIQPAFRKQTKTGGVVRIDAANFNKVSPAKGVSWRRVGDLGLGDGALVSYPQGRPATALMDGVWAEYDLPATEAGDLKVALRLSPTLNTSRAAPLRIGVSIDDQPAQLLSFHLTPTPGSAQTQDQRDWVAAVIDNAHTVSATFPALSAGRHRLRLWRIDDNVVVDEIQVQTAESAARS